MAFADASLRIALAAVFLFAAVSKVHRARARRDFAATIHSLGPVPERAVPPVAASVVGAEFVTALLLLDPRLGVHGPAAAVLALTAFTAVVVRSVRRGDRTACSCFGRTREPMGRAHVYRNSILLAMAAGALGLAAHGRHAFDAEAIAPAIPLGVFWAFLLASFTEFFSLIRPRPATRSVDRG
ncbi:MauE/DoxX family redox-associated membrane protein [Actinomadura sp. 21ATH]|uniref:MauE/DoxX family redox-associated membrane protein n=1 Tax=Actinomadura sp. 21ATH TaxID=1735444 RepID=UPI0035C0DFAC